MKSWGFLKNKMKEISKTPSLINAKLYFDNQNETRRIKIERDVSYVELLQGIETVMEKLNLEGLRINKLAYKDFEEDWINFSTEQEWLDCVDQHKVCTVIRIQVLTKKGAVKQSEIILQKERKVAKKNPKPVLIEKKKMWDRIKEFYEALSDFDKMSQTNYSQNILSPRLPVLILLHYKDDDVQGALNEYITFVDESALSGHIKAQILNGFGSHDAVEWINFFTGSNFDVECVLYMMNKKSKIDKNLIFNTLKDVNMWD